MLKNCYLSTFTLERRNKNKILWKKKYLNIFHCFRGRPLLRTAVTGWIGGSSSDSSEELLIIGFSIDHTDGGALTCFLFCKFLADVPEVEGWGEVETRLISSALTLMPGGTFKRFFRCFITDGRCLKVYSIDTNAHL